MADIPALMKADLWLKFKQLIPQRHVYHPKNGHRPRVSDYIIFTCLIELLHSGKTYKEVAATSTVSATTLRRRRDEWMALGLMEELEILVLVSYDDVIGLELDDLSVDGCITKARSGGSEDLAGRSPVDRGKKGTKRSIVVDGTGVTLGCVVAPAQRHDSPLLEPTLRTLDRLKERLNFPARPTVHLDAGYDSRVSRATLEELGYDWNISAKGDKKPKLGNKRSVVEHANAWHNAFNRLNVTNEVRNSVQMFYITLANLIIVARRLYYHEREQRRARQNKRRAEMP